jgi:tetratricopeptide (TPR) repeat protein
MHDHIRFADMLYKSGNKEEAISYYEKALAMADVTGASQNEKKAGDLLDDREWAYYRIGKGLEKIRDGRLKRLGEVIAREREINERLKEVL